MSAQKNYWLVKQEPTEFSWDDFTAAGRTVWDGVRNYAARNHLKAMRPGDEVLFYHSVKGKCVVGVAKVDREWYPDPQDERWVCVELVPLRALARPVTLAEIKSCPELADLPLIRQSRLSVMPLSAEQFSLIVAMGGE
ncbi:MAG: EVE domain-containing protein [Bacteroidia bacterium]|nr:EVE domain-containing protein [Bacteroidia bacterium]MDW8334378.1 EVE domain-containing protein [Bacteroidia bacterium]